MLHETLPDFFIRDLLKLKDELQQYKSETQLWVVDKQVSNSAGNLCLHLIGNLNHFIGSCLGNTDYVRTRDVEFSSKNIPLQQLLSDIDATAAMVKNTLTKLTVEDYTKDFPLLMQNRVVTTEQMLLHLLTHLSYHIGQINYHRRLLD
jgi:uncharacterized damage-inducible protein DinB